MTARQISLDWLKKVDGIRLQPNWHCLIMVIGALTMAVLSLKEEK